MLPKRTLAELLLKWWYVPFAVVVLIPLDFLAIWHQLANRHGFIEKIRSTIYGIRLDIAEERTALAHYHRFIETPSEIGRVLHWGDVISSGSRCAVAGVLCRPLTLGRRFHQITRRFKRFQGAA